MEHPESSAAGVACHSGDAEKENCARVAHDTVFFSAFAAVTFPVMRRSQDDFLSHAVSQKDAYDDENIFEQRAKLDQVLQFFELEYEKFSGYFDDPQRMESMRVEYYNCINAIEFQSEVLSQLAPLLQFDSMSRFSLFAVVEELLGLRGALRRGEALEMSRKDLSIRLANLKLDISDRKTKRFFKDRLQGRGELASQAPCNPSGGGAVHLMGLNGGREHCGQEKERRQLVETLSPAIAEAKTQRLLAEQAGSAVESTPMDAAPQSAHMEAGGAGPSIILTAMVLLRFIAAPWVLLLLQPSACMQQLNDETFEHQTQASTGMTTGSWLVTFGASGCGSCGEFREALDGVEEELRDIYVIPAHVDKADSAGLQERFLHHRACLRRYWTRSRATASDCGKHPSSGTRQRRYKHYSDKELARLPSCVPEFRVEQPMVSRLRQGIELEMAVCVDLIGAKLRLLARHGYKSMKVTLVYPPVRLEPTTIPPGSPVFGAVTPQQTPRFVSGAGSVPVPRTALTPVPGTRQVSQPPQAATTPAPPCVVTVGRLTPRTPVTLPAKLVSVSRSPVPQVIRSERRPEAREPRDSVFAPLSMIQVQIEEARDLGLRTVSQLFTSLLKHYGG
eukprot:s498_g15.t1